MVLLRFRRHEPSISAPRPAPSPGMFACYSGQMAEPFDITVSRPADAHKDRRRGRRASHGLGPPSRDDSQTEYMGGAGGAGDAGGAGGAGAGAAVATAAVATAAGGGPESVAVTPAQRDAPPLDATTPGVPPLSAPTPAPPAVATAALPFSPDDYFGAGAGAASAGPPAVSASLVSASPSAAAAAPAMGGPPATYLYPSATVAYPAAAYPVHPYYSPAIAGYTPISTAPTTVTTATTATATTTTPTTPAPVTPTNATTATSATTTPSYLPRHARNASTAPPQPVELPVDLPDSGTSVYSHSPPAPFSPMSMSALSGISRQPSNGAHSAYSTSFSDVHSPLLDQQPTQLSRVSSERTAASSPPSLLARLSSAVDRQDDGDELPPPPPPPTSTSIRSLDPDGDFTTTVGKVYHYGNARVTQDLQPAVMFPATYPLLCLAAELSARSYRPPDDELEAVVDADRVSRGPTVVLRALAVDHTRTLAVSVRAVGSSLSDLATGAISSDPVPPVAFLDDSNNACHSGFLAAARSAAPVVAILIRQLLAQQFRPKYSLLLTGHGPGGAIAALLFSHMLSETLPHADLVCLRALFKRGHCITFGAPSVSLMPLSKPCYRNYGKWLFYTFVNEGDPVVRADRACITSLLDCYRAPVPPMLTETIERFYGPGTRQPSISVSASSVVLPSRFRRRRERGVTTRLASRANPDARWPIPAGTFALGGSLILLRSNSDDIGGGGAASAGATSDGPPVSACYIGDDELRPLIFGDPAMHAMRLYLRRIETVSELAVRQQQAALEQQQRSVHGHGHSLHRSGWSW